MIDGFNSPMVGDHVVGIAHNGQPTFITSHKDSIAKFNDVATLSILENISNEVIEIYSPTTVLEG
jgi:hypothetical protein